MIVTFYQLEPLTCPGVQWMESYGLMLCGQPTNKAMKRKWNGVSHDAYLMMIGSLFL